jgi:radical SAM superfamily enzyme YgiQ (UPF0313 family)
MNALLVSPRFPTTYWGFQYGLPLAGKRCSLPPLGLLTLAAQLPVTWSLRLVDLNIAPLTDRDLAWADAVLVGGMRVQAASMHEVIAQARVWGIRSVVGGPAPTTAPGEWGDADVVFIGEVEGRIDELVAALAADTPCVVRERGGKPALGAMPVPRFDLLELDAYASMSIQYSRGCPYACEFCDVIEIFGRAPRVKEDAQVLAELDALAALGYRGSVFLVDDNFIGNRPAVRRLLPAIASWQADHGRPFYFYTEASVNLAGDPDLIAAMVAAGFRAVFVGIETPSTEALASVGKKQNLKVDLAAAITTLSRAGLEVMGGFIVGFDSDDPRAFAAQRDFIAGAPMPLAMVGVLTALPGTALWRRLEREGRLRTASAGDQFCRPNFTPVMDEVLLLRGYAELLADLYEPEAYYARCAAFVDCAAEAEVPRSALPHGGITTMLRTARDVGGHGLGSRRPFWRLVSRTLVRAPHLVPWLVARAITGEHLIRYTRDDVLPRLGRAIAEADDAGRRGGPHIGVQPSDSAARSAPCLDRRPG